MFKLQRLEITGFKSFADYTEIVFTGNGITAVVGPNGCGKSNVSDAISWVLGEQRAKSLRGGEMKDVVFAGTKSRKPGGMAEVVLHLVRDDSVDFGDDNELEDIDEALSGIDEMAVDMDEIEGIEEVDSEQLAVGGEENGHEFGQIEPEVEVETVMAAQVGSIQTVEKKIKTKRHWRPRSFALDFAPGEAVSVTRRLYMSGESEYQLNGKNCRLRDISDLFAGTGLSGSHYAIIEQGRIGQILSSKPADRRNLIEEAAGISKFRTRQRAAESRLDSAKTNLGRISDIVSEIDKQVNSLRRQAAKTRRFKILQEEFRVLLRQLFAAEGKHLTELSGQLEIDLAKAAELEAGLHNELLVKEEATKESTVTARNAEESLAELRKIHSTNALERDRAEREHIYKSEQVVNLNNRMEVLHGEIAASEQRLALLTTELERLQEEEQKESVEFNLSEAALREADEIHARDAESLRAVESAMELVRAELLQHTAAGERFDEIGRQLDINLDRLTQRAGGLEAEAKRAEQTFAEHEKQASELAHTLSAEEKKLNELNAEKDELMAVTTASLEALRTAESALDTLNEEHSAKRHRLATLLELEEKRAVYTPQVQKLFAEQKAIGVKLAGVLADKLNVAEKAETAVETLFGDYLQAVLVESLDDAKRVSAWLKSNNIGRTAMLILPSGGKSTAVSDSKGDTIGESLGVSAEIAALLRDVFPREMSARLVDDLDGAKSSDILINHEGDLLLGGRLFVGGKQRSDGKNESLLAFKRELTGLEKITKRLASEIETAKTSTEKARRTLADNETKMVDLQSLIIKVDRGVHGLQIQVRTAREEIERAERHRKVVADESGQTVIEIAELRQKRDDALSNKKAADLARAESTAALERIAKQMADSRTTLEAARSVLDEKRMIAATSSERRRSVQSALRRVENEGKEIESRLAIQNLEISEADAKVKALHASITDITDRIANAGDDVSRENAELTAAINALATARANSDATSEELAELNRRLGDARNERASIEIRQAEAVTQLRNTAENCQQELNIALAELVE